MINLVFFPFAHINIVILYFIGHSLFFMFSVWSLLRVTHPDSIPMYCITSTIIIIITVNHVLLYR